MKSRFYVLLILSLLIALTACGDVSVDTEGTDTATPSHSTESVNSNQETANNEETSNNEIANTNEESESTEPSESTGNESDNSLKIIGKITYDRVGVKSNGVGLDYGGMTKETANQVVVKAIDSTGKVVASTTTDDSGNYSLTNLPSNTEIKVRVYAQLEKSGTGGWSVKVVDNTRNSSKYVLEGSLISTGNSSTRRNLHASSGWDGFSYSKTREAAPFAILGSIYQSINKVLKADSSATFPPLVVNWSENNVAAGGSIADGQIGTSHYNFNDGALYILGDANSDTDEYDDHIIIHEWGHYFESKFSRADSIGGAHTTGDRLDIRLAFGEGWGNAWSAIATDDPIYYDTMWAGQSGGWSMNIEGEYKVVPGFYSEASIQRILYDLYDSNDDGADTLSMGFKPIYDVLVGKQKNTKAFTSIFSFIKGLKDENPESNSKIDAILSSENIETIEDIYGDNQHNIYSDMSVGDTVEVCTSIRYGMGSQGNHNIFGNHKYIRFDVNNKGTYKVKMVQSSKGNSDPDFALYRVADSFQQYQEARGSVPNVEEASYTLVSGSYILDIVAWNPNETTPCFNITIN